MTNQAKRFSVIAIGMTTVWVNLVAAITSYLHSDFTPIIIALMGNAATALMVGIIIVAFKKFPEVKDTRKSTTPSTRRWTGVDSESSDVDLKYHGH